MRPISDTRVERDRVIDRLGTETFDVVVIGAGVTGAGVALDAASRGLRTALLEGGDFASGTSSRSSKMVHGGFRYLLRGDVGLVVQALRERQHLLDNAPHLVRLLAFMIPVHTSGGLIPRRWARLLGVALWIYHLLGGWRIGKRHQRLSKEEALAHMPSLRRADLSHAYLYYDAGVDDARLALTLARTAAIDHGAVVANHLPVVDVVKNDQGHVTGVVADTGTGLIDICARAVVNAGGVWVDEVHSLDAVGDTGRIRPAKGVHLVVPASSVGNDVAVVLPQTRGKGSIFVAPWGDFTYVGTADTDYEGDLSSPHCNLEDLVSLLDGLNASITEPVAIDEVSGTWAGLRPLLRTAEGASTAELSRHHRVTRSASGVVTIAGGKLTTYRLMAEHTVDEVLRGLGMERTCRTRKLALYGADGYDEVHDDGGLDEAVLEHLVSRFGGQARALITMVTDDPALGEPIVAGLPYIGAEVRYAVVHEMAQTVDDVLSRRTRARLLARDASTAAADSVARLMAGPLGWSPEEVRAQVAAYHDSVGAELAALQDPVTRAVEGGCVLV